MPRIRRRARPALHRLQTLQIDFDRERGLDFRQLEEVPGIQLAFEMLMDRDERAAEARLRLVEFTALALAGEVGELANAVKKARRGAWLGQDFADRMREAESEAADVFAYLLKLSYLLRRNLDELYLEKMSENCLRFPVASETPQSRLVALLGPPGAGKTTIATALASEFHTYIEEQDENPYLGKLMDDREFQAFANQDWFLSRLERFVGESDLDADLLLDQDPAAVVRVYGRFYRDAGLMTPGDYTDLLLRLLDLESAMASWRPRAILVLDAPADTLRERVSMRWGEGTPPIEWFERLRGYFGLFASRLPDPVVISTAGLPCEAVVERVRERLARE